MKNKAFLNTFIHNFIFLIYITTMASMYIPFVPSFEDCLLVISTGLHFDSQVFQSVHSIEKRQSMLDRISSFSLAFSMSALHAKN